MNILWLYNMPLIPEAGGTERVTSLVARGLTALGHTCFGILEFKEDSDEITYRGEKVESLSEFLRDNKIDVVINQIAYSKWLLKSFLDKGGEQWQKNGGIIISCLHFDPKPASSLYYFCQKRDKSAIDYFNIAKAFLLYGYYKKCSYLRTGCIFKWIYHKSDFFVTLSSTHFPFLKRVTGLNDYSKLRAINNPLTFDGISGEEVFEKKNKVILVCSRMDEYQKRLSIALKVWEKIQDEPSAGDWRIKFVGSGPDLNKYRHMANSRGLKRINFEGRQDAEPYYEEADIFLMTSCGIEGWGLTLTESLQRAVVPIVLDTCPVYREIIDHGYNGYLVSDGHINDMAKIVLSLIENPQRLRKLQHNALSSASRFTLSSTMQKWIPLLAQ